MKIKVFVLFVFFNLFVIMWVMLFYLGKRYNLVLLWVIENVFRFIVELFRYFGNLKEVDLRNYMVYFLFFFF